jgi:acetyltransferase-like isoleucine patch superfamily enzyme
MTFSAAIDLAREKFRSRRNRMRKRKYTPHTVAEHLRSCGAQVGSGCFIASMNLEVGNEAYLLRIGDHVAIEPDVEFNTHDGAAWVFRHHVPDLQVYGPIIIEDNCFIGRGAILCPGIRIGPNSIVEAGAVVITDVPPNTVVAGVPARAVVPARSRTASALTASL